VVPDTGGADSADVVEVLVAVGDEIEADQGLVVLESDKASMEVPAPMAGRVLELAASDGSQVLGLFGTVTGMIGAFQALQEAGAQADPATLAGGIWQALLTTAAGMAVAIPAQIALTGFEGVLDRLRRDLEDRATAVFLAVRRAQARAAA